MGKYGKIIFLMLAAIAFGCKPDTQSSDGSVIRREKITAEDYKFFQEPPAEFRPQTWFHFISGNVALQGMKADIKAISGAGFSGIQFFHGHRSGEPWPGVEPQIECLSGDWDDLVRQLAEECRKYGLQFTMQNCPGWAMAGGPWIEPEDAMRHLVWSRTDIDGGQTVNMELPRPLPSEPEWRDYRDVAVIAFPTPADDTGEPLEPVKVASNRSDPDWELWIKREKGSAVVLEAGEEPTWVEMEFDREVTVRTVEFPSVESLDHGWVYDPSVEVKVEALFDNKPDKTIAHLNLPPGNWQEDKPLTIACEEALSKRYRLSVKNSRYSITLNPVTLYSAARKANWEGEAAWVLRGMDGLHDPDQNEDTRVRRETIINLTGNYDEGNLKWEVPEGRWTVLRWGHVNTGMKNGPAPPEATGFECNKLSPSGAETHFAGYIGRLSAADGPLQGNLLQGMLLDSWECRTQTWTPEMADEFRQRNGYDLFAWLPAIAGYIIDDPEITSRFLRDWRAVINDLLVENFYGRMAELAHERGLKTYFETAAGDVFPGDILEYYKHADVPMCEYWHPRTESFVGSIEFKPVKPAVSASRLYGKNRVAAEAFTSFKLTWNEHPGMLKPIADMHFAMGVTYPVFHTYTHTPRTDFLPPGTSFGDNIGSPFLRGQTWWGHMPEFTRYLSRCTYMLERGRPVSDVLFYPGDESGHKPKQTMPVPGKYQYDYCNHDILMNRLAVRNGRVETPEGLSYRLIWLQNTKRMLPETIERLADFVKQGAVVVGNPPENIATLIGGQQAEKRFREAVKSLWGESGETERPLGKGLVLSGISVEEALKKLNIESDLSVESINNGRADDLLWLHRQINSADWYFVAAPQAAEGFAGTLRFRSAGKVELWDPVTGKITDAKVAKKEDNNTYVEVALPPSGSVFIVFKAGERASGTNENNLFEKRVLPVNSRWRIEFPGGWGAPDSLFTDSLKPWKDLNLSEEGRAFSGTATYKTEFNLDSQVSPKQALLDLGRVNMVAKVMVNGKVAGTVWTEPYIIDITEQVKNGFNELEIEVTGTWFNRLVFDAGQSEAERKTWTIKGPSEKEELISYGLLKPVNIIISD